MRLFLVICLAALAGCESRPGKPVPGRDDFRAASSKISSDSNGTAHGNTEQARIMAAAFSEAMGAVDKQAFTGHKKRSFSLTGEKFLTYCHQSGDKLVFLVHVPQLKAYKREVRDELISLAWEVANFVVTKAGAEGVKRVGVGLRGSVMYGGLAIGDLGSTSPQVENAAAVDEKKLYEFFAAPTTSAAPSAPQP